jgi:hypothetical protein
VCVINKNTHIRMCVIGELRKSAGAIIIVDEDSNYNYSERIVEGDIYIQYWGKTSFDPAYSDGWLKRFRKTEST